MLEYGEVVAPLVLGSVKRKVGAAHQLFRIAIAVMASRHAHAGGHLVAVTVDFIRRPDHRQETVGPLDQHAVAGACLDKHGKLVAAKTRDRVFVPHFAGQAFGDLAQQAITDEVSARVVDGLEVVEIEIEQSHVGAARPVIAEQFAQALVEEVAVGQIGQAVVMRHLGDALFDQAICGHIARDAAHAAITARAGGKLPVAGRPIDGNAYRDIAEGMRVDDMLRQLIAAFSRLHQVEDG